MGDAEGSPEQRTGVVAKRMQKRIVEAVYECGLPMGQWREETTLKLVNSQPR